VVIYEAFVEGKLEAPKHRDPHRDWDRQWAPGSVHDRRCRQLASASRTV
jgi:hypothetical protein